MTARKTASAAGAFERAADARRPRTTPAPPPPAMSRRQELDPETESSKYTVILTPGEAADFDALQLAARRQLGRRVDKSTIVRALLGLAGDDATLRQQLIEELRGRR